MSPAWLAECRAALDELADGRLQRVFGIAEKAHRHELLDRLAETNPLLIVAIGDTLRLGQPSLATGAVATALVDLRGDEPEMFVGSPSPDDLTNLVVLTRYGDAGTDADMRLSIFSDCERLGVEGRRRLLWQVLREMRERGETLPDFGPRPAQPKLSGLPKPRIAPTPKRLPKPVPIFVQAPKPALRALHR